MKRRSLMRIGEHKGLSFGTYPTKKQGGQPVRWADEFKNFFQGNMNF